MLPMNQLIEAQKRFQEDLLSRANVVGVAVGYRDYKGEPTDELALVTLVERKKPIEALDPADIIPRTLDGARTDVVEIGHLRANDAGPRGRHRPTIPAGVSIGHTRVTAGTLGAIVKDKDTGDRLLLSNNHVLANSNDAFIGDFILQPAPTDHGQNPADRVARLERFSRLYFVGDPPPTSPQPPPVGGGGGTGRSGCDVVDLIVKIGNLIARLNGSDKRLAVESVSAQIAGLEATQTYENQLDAALAKPIKEDMFSSEIRNIGKVKGTKPASIGMQIHKSGRTTDYTQGRVNLLNATVNVSYNTTRGARVARFTNQVISTPLSQGGDSGSLILEQGSNAAVGLLFAGSSLSTIFTPIQTILDTLNVEFE